MSGPGPWEVSLASSGTLRIMTDLQGMEDFGLEWACRMDFYGCKAVNKLVLMLSSFSAVYTVHFPYILVYACMYSSSQCITITPLLLFSGNQAFEACTPSTVPSLKKYLSINRIVDFSWRLGLSF